MKNRIVIFGVIFVVGVLGAWFFYWGQPQFGFQSNKERPRNKDEARNICEFYQYDKSNPGVHSSFDKSYHDRNWQNYEEREGPTGAKNIDEFCRL